MSRVCEARDCKRSLDRKRSDALYCDDTCSKRERRARTRERQHEPAASGQWTRGLSQDTIEEIAAIAEERPHLPIIEWIERRPELTDAIRDGFARGGPVPWDELRNGRPGDASRPPARHPGALRVWDDAEGLWQSANVWAPSSLPGDQGLPDLDHRGRRVAVLAVVERLMIRAEGRVRGVEILPPSERTSAGRVTTDHGSRCRCTTPAGAAYCPRCGGWVDMAAEVVTLDERREYDDDGLERAA